MLVISMLFVLAAQTGLRANPAGLLPVAVVLPTYPPAARHGDPRVEFSVQLSVGSSGETTDARIERESSKTPGFTAEFRSSLLYSLKQWRYPPGRGMRHPRIEVIYLALDSDDCDGLTETLYDPPGRIVVKTYVRIEGAIGPGPDGENR